MQSKKAQTNFWVNEKQATSVNVCFFTFFALDTTTHQLVSILDLALKFNCLPLLVLEAKRKLFGGNVFGLFVFWEVCAVLLCLCQQKSRIRLCLHGKSSQHEHLGLKKVVHF